MINIIRFHGNGLMTEFFFLELKILLAISEGCDVNKFGKSRFLVIEV